MLGGRRESTLPELASVKPGGLTKVVFLDLGRGGELRSMTHCGGGGGFAGDSCAMLICDEGRIEQ